MDINKNMIFILEFIFLFINFSNGQYSIDDSYGLGRRFDGIGAISGGGATSKLLMNYNESLRNQVLDFLFKPNFGASLHILKVEIGGDSQSTDGVEASHMHTANDENYQRGYEWWMMKEAKKRNPNIKLYGLPWVFPGWLGGQDFNPYSNRSELVRYVVNWVKGAKSQHDLTIDYVGIWNERAYDTTYIKMLRKALDQSGFSNVEIVVTDAEWSIVNDIVNDPELLAAVGPIGAHYPGSHSPSEALTTDRPLWASEEYSAFNDLSGGGCWARVLCESYVNGHLSAVIAWNLITSYYDNLPYPRSSLMVANSPWSGHYEVSSPIWTSAHFTQFLEPGWKYFPHGLGVGNLTGNGSYVALTSPDGKYLTIIVETLAPSTSHCFYSMPKYPIVDQIATFTLKGSLANIEQLTAWYSYLDFTGNKTILFEKVDAIKVINGQFQLNLPVNTIYTLTTLPSTAGHKGSYPKPPDAKPFPSEYSDDFEKYPLHAEAFNLAQQAGSFEVLPSSDTAHGNVIVQMVPQPPVDTCRPKRMTRPAIVFGNFEWSDVSVQYDFKLDQDPSAATGVYLAARVTSGGCDIMYSNGIYVWASALQNTITLTGNHTSSLVFAKVSVRVLNDEWHTLGLNIQEPRVRVTFDNTTVVDLNIPSLVSKHGFLAMGTENFARASFDNLLIRDTKSAKNPEKAQYGDRKSKTLKPSLAMNNAIRKVHL